MCVDSGASALFSCAVCCDCVVCLLLVVLLVPCCCTTLNTHHLLPNRRRRPHSVPLPVHKYCTTILHHTCHTHATQQYQPANQPANHTRTCSRSSAPMSPYFHLKSRDSSARPRTSAEGWPGCCLWHVVVRDWKEQQQQHMVVCRALCVERSCAARVCVRQHMLSVLHAPTYPHQASLLCSPCVADKGILSPLLQVFAAALLCVAWLHCVNNNAL